jgi:hypothetical protein
MNRALVSVLALTGLALALPAMAQGQRWPSIRSRESAFEQRLQDGEQSGAISPDEALRLRATFEDLVAREQDYRYSPPGLTLNEVQDLDYRFGVLSDRLSSDLAQGPANQSRNPNRYTRRPYNGPPPTDRDEDRLGAATVNPPIAAPSPAPDRSSGVDDGWPSMNERRADLLARIEAGVTAGDLTRSEAAGLREDFEGLIRREDFYRQDGQLSTAERRDLDQAFADLSRRIHRERTDDQRLATATPPPPVAATPAETPPANDRTRWRDIRNVQADLDERIDEAKENQTIGEGEAKRLHEDASDLIRLEDDYRASPPGLTREEITDLEARIAAIEDRVGRPPPEPAKPNQRAVNDF